MWLSWLLHSMRNFLHSPICPRVSIPRDLGGSCQTFYDLGSEVTQYYICHSLLWVTGPAESQHVRQLCEGMSVGGIVHWGPSLETNSQWVERAVFGGKAQRRHCILGDSQRKSRSLPSEERGRKTKDERKSSSRPRKPAVQRLGDKTRCWGDDERVVFMFYHLLPDYLDNISTSWFPHLWNGDHQLLFRSIVKIELVNAWRVLQNNFWYWANSKCWWLLVLYRGTWVVNMAGT